MSIAADIHKLEPGSYIDLYILDFNSIGIGKVYYFYPGTDQNFGPLRFQGQDYAPWPIKMSGFKKRGSGAEHRPKASVSNIGGLITTDLETYEDMAGVVVKKRKTLGQYLNTEIPDSATYSEEMFFIEQKVNENAIVVEFELASAMDFIDKRLPGRIAVANSCPWQYATTANGSGCGWPRTDPSKYFDLAGTSVVTLQEDVCGKRLTDCKLRFGADKPLDFGGFPALGRI